jgi:hypothetical protein
MVLLAVISFTESHYDLVILDIRLPRIGIQLYKIMKSIRPGVKALINSAEEFITILPDPDLDCSHPVFSLSIHGVLK